MTKPLAVLFCPGRGSYGRPELGSIGLLEPRGLLAEALDVSDAERAREHLPTVRELDSSEKFRPGQHLDGRNAAELIYFATMADLTRLQERYEIVAVAGNSLGWYTALAAAGSLDPIAGRRLIATMARLQDGVPGGQLLTTTIGSDWLPDPDLVRGIEDAMAQVSAEHFVARSIRLGGHEVLAGTEPGLSSLLELLPKVEGDARGFPFRLAGHGPFHTALCADVAQRASEALEDLRFGMPKVHLIDGRGDLHTPWSADPDELFDYTTRAQVIETFDFSAAVRTAIREFQPDLLLCAGPGTSLRAPVGHVVLREGYRGLQTKADLFESGIVHCEPVPGLAV